MIINLHDNWYLGQKGTKRGASSDECCVKDKEGLRPLVMTDAVAEAYK